MSEVVEDTSEAEPRGGSVHLQITYFTDPLCCWSWGFEPQLRRLRFAYAGRLAWRVRMGGMVSDWNQFDDPLNAVHRPAQMAPLWIQARHVTGMPLEPHLWMTDPPASSWPSCLAVKAAELQSPAAADLYLRRVREAAMVEGRNIARPEVLLDVAAAAEADRPDLFDAGAFAADLDGREAWRAFQEDRKEARFRGVGRFPCLMIQPAGAPPVFLVGWRPYPDLQQAVAAAAPDIGPERRPGSAEAYRTYWARLSERELSEATGPDLSPALADPPASASSGSGA